MFRDGHICIIIKDEKQQISHIMHMLHNFLPSKVSTYVHCTAPDLDKSVPL